MKTWFGRFNTYLLLLPLLCLAGCKTTEDKKKEFTLIRFHIEVHRDASSHYRDILMFRDHPMRLTVDADPFLDERDVQEAGVVPALGGFAIKIQFNQHGTWVLENFTSANVGRRIAVLAQFPEGRWIGARVIDHRVSDGQWIFTPDASLDEAERIVRGINATVAKIKKKSSF